MQLSIPRHRVVWLHLSFWCVYLSFNLYTFTFFQRDREVEWDFIFINVGLQLFFTLVIVYLNYFFVLPRFLEHQKIWQYLVEFIIPFAVIITLRIYLQRRILEPYDHRHFFYSNFFIVQTVAITLFITIFVGMLRFAVDWFEFESKKKEVENEKLATELNFLKAQINPHFLFNTLNNLYYLAYTKSANTTEVIAKLSQMMRYMIYESNHTKVQLSREIEYMENYISLERLRLNNQIPINFNVKNVLHDVRIAPLILITFLENAFKHGVSNNSTNEWVNISLELKDNEIVYIVENSKLPEMQRAKITKSGIGLQNVQRRLDLSYPGQYTLKVTNAPDRYRIELKLIIA